MSLAFARHISPRYSFTFLCRLCSYQPVSGRDSSQHVASKPPRMTPSRGGGVEAGPLRKKASRYTTEARVRPVSISFPPL